MPQELNGFWVSRQPDEKQWLSERRSKKFDGSKSFDFCSIRNEDVQEVRCRNKAPVRRKAAGTTKVNQPGGFQREGTKHNCGPIPYFRSG
jgi:hypothetical protein